MELNDLSEEFIVELTQEELNELKGGYSIICPNGIPVPPNDDDLIDKKKCPPFFPNGIPVPPNDDDLIY
jgi:hypothetical protein